MRNFLHKFFSKKTVKVILIILLSLVLLFTALMGFAYLISEHGEYLSVYLAGGSGSKQIGETTVVDSEFAYCDELKNMTIANTVTSIEKNAFMGCSNLKNVNFVNNSTLTTIGEAAFCCTNNLKKISLPDSVTTIEKHAFANSGLTSITIPDNVVKIGNEAFASCENLTSVTIPANTTEIGDSVFKQCTSLKTIEVHPDNPNYCSVDGVLYNKDMTRLIAWPCKKTVDKIPDSVTTIAKSALSFNDVTFSIVLPEDIAIIEPYAFEASDYLEITFPENTELKTIEAGTFLYCTMLSNIVIPDGIESIEQKAFLGCPITTLEIPRSVKKLGYAAFSATDITSLFIPNTLETVEGCVFASCTSLTTVEIEEGLPAIYEGMFYSCEALTEINIPTSVKAIENSAFCCCTNLRNMIIPENVETIGEYAFSHCERLFNIQLPTGLKELSDNIFAHCFMLKEVDIPECVARIGRNAFANCKNLKEIKFPTNLQSIEELALTGCTNITHLSVPASVSKVGNWAFSYMDSLNTLVFLHDDTQAPNTVLGEQLLKGTYNLKSLTLAPHIQKIGKEAFAHNQDAKIYFSGTSDEWLAIRHDDYSIPKNPLIIFTDTVCDIHGGYESATCHMCY